MVSQHLAQSPSASVAFMPPPPPLLLLLLRL
jgi:hypothetical protein